MTEVSNSRHEEAHHMRIRGRGVFYPLGGVVSVLTHLEGCYYRLGGLFLAFFCMSLFHISYPLGGVFLPSWKVVFILIFLLS